MDTKQLNEELTHLLVAQLRGFTVDLLTRKSGEEQWEENGVGVSVGKGRTVRVDDVVDLVLKHGFKASMVEAKDAELARFLANVKGVVMATREEQHQIWARWHRGDVGWIKTYKAATSGILQTVGHLAGRPICVSLSVDTINEQRIVFVDTISQLVDHELVDRWVEAHMPEEAFRDGQLNRTDATNFTNVLDRS